MKVTQVGQTYTLSDLTKTELEAILHPHNVLGFAESLEEPYKSASKSIWDCLGSDNPALCELNSIGYAGREVANMFADAMTKVVL